MPFVFAHLGKPEIELFSTLFGGLVYAWVDWRTRSIVWSTIAHVYIVTLLVLLAAG
jgi:membrane protease YdiL (CAAX protease family)